MKWIFASTLTMIVFSNAMAAEPTYPWEKHTQQNGLYKITAPSLFTPTNLENCLDTTNDEKANGFMNLVQSSKQISMVIEHCYKNDVKLFILDIDETILKKIKHLIILRVADKSGQHIVPHLYNTHGPIHIPFKAIRGVICLCRKNLNTPWTVTQYIEPQKLT